MTRQVSGARRSATNHNTASTTPVRALPSDLMKCMLASRLVAPLTCPVASLRKIAIAVGTESQLTTEMSELISCTQAQPRPLPTLTSVMVAMPTAPATAELDTIIRTGGNPRRCGPRACSQMGTAKARPATAGVFTTDAVPRMAEPRARAVQLPWQTTASPATRRPAMSRSLCPPPTPKTSVSGLATPNHKPNSVRPPIRLAMDGSVQAARSTPTNAGNRRRRTATVG